MERMPATGAAEPVLAFDRVSKVYRLPGGGTVAALREATAVVPAGRSVAVVGRSGSGKSTLLHLAAGVDAPTSGRVRLRGRDLSRMGDRERTLARRDGVGLVFQFFHLLPHLGVLDNVLLPALVAGLDPRREEPRARSLLERVGLAGRERHAVQRLSGGEMQRVALCRALLRKPALLLADEPTGNLDEENGARAMELLLDLARGEGSALVYVTHSREIAALADERWTLHSGVLEAG
ncbi:MAG TPA: ABC transporter ATP-binding protein [Anaeromyxobacteraceae bacterium]|nr:ABC transporter ATP-binding protein [Anaeromyxobacteraceae bacterium]